MKRRDDRLESEILTPFTCLAIARRAGPDLADGNDCKEEITGKCVGEAMLTLINKHLLRD